MRRILLLLVFLMLQLAARATHIVGGEFQLKHLNGSSYALSLYLYFDAVNGNINAVEPQAPVFIFEKGTNRLVTTIYLPRTSWTNVAYTSIECTNASLSTQKITYSSTIALSEAIYTHPQGYYAVWERCCRNNVINNIIQPGNAGQVFYMEFPPVRVNNQPFINSSPELFPPLSDYACIDELFYYDFGGKDVDGDSLVYEMVTPLNGNTSSGMPTPSSALPAPYSTVRWTAGLSGSNQIPGNPTVTIHRNSGRLTLRPTQLGLYVFGIRCSEYRKGVKIGEIRRDFQLLVLNCPKNTAPRIQLKQAGKSSFYREGDILQVKAGDNRCLELFLTDSESNTPLTVEAKPVNFNFSDRILDITSGLVNRNGGKDTLRTTACFPACLNSSGKTYLIDFIVGDNGCSLPKKDTVRVSFQIEPTTNLPPSISTTAPGILRPKLNETVEFEVTGLDPDNDFVQLTVAGQNFALANQAVSFNPTSGTGRSRGRFSWKIDCRAMTQPSYILEFRAQTTNCGAPVTVTTLVEVRPEVTDVPPTIRTTAPAQVLRPRLGEKITFDVLGADENGDMVALGLTGTDFDVARQNISFQSASGLGSAISRFTWDIDCNAVNQEVYTLRFTVTSLYCNQFITRSTIIEVRPDYQNVKPTITAGMEGKIIEVVMGSNFSDTIYANDADLNPIVIAAAGNGFNLADREMAFVPGAGKGRAKAIFTWSPACKITPNGTYQVLFSVTENTCKPHAPETIAVTFLVKEREIKPFRPANIFTPNNDGLNDLFTLPDLPQDFCSSVFADIRIYNRWGSLIYASKSRNFQWDGKNATDGVYFYHITYSDKTYKGTVTVVR